MNTYIIVKSDGNEFPYTVLWMQYISPTPLQLVVVYITTPFRNKNIEWKLPRWTLWHFHTYIPHPSPTGLGRNDEPLVIFMTHYFCLLHSHQFLHINFFIGEFMLNWSDMFITPRTFDPLIHLNIYLVHILHHFLSFLRIQTQIQLQMGAKWCSMAKVCNHDRVPVCGVSHAGDIMGFRDLCDMFDFNCIRRRSLYILRLYVS